MPRLGVPKTVGLAASGGFGLAYLAWNRVALRKQRWGMLALAIGAFAISLLVDEIYGVKDDRSMWRLAEDGSKPPEAARSFSTTGIRHGSSASEGPEALVRPVPGTMEATRGPPRAWGCRQRGATTRRSRMDRGDRGTFRALTTVVLKPWS